MKGEINMIGTGKLKNAYLNGDLCFCLWLTTGSIGKATMRMSNEGIRHPLRGTPPGRMGIWSAASRSQMYKEFMEARTSGKIESLDPTKEEIINAKKYIEEVFPMEKAKNAQELRDYKRVKVD
jgi:hypothetical protein